MSDLEREFADLWVALFPECDLHSEYRFHPTRKFRLDFAHIPSKVGVECQGAIWTLGAHSSGVGLRRDYEKMLLAAACGWQILPLSADAINEENLRLIKQVIDQREAIAA